MKKNGRGEWEGFLKQTSKQTNKINFLTPFNGVCREPEVAHTLSCAEVKQKRHHLHCHIMPARDWLCWVARRWECLYSHWVYRRFYPPSQQPHGYRGQILLFQFHTRGSCQLKAMEQWSIGHRGPIHCRTRGPASLLTPDSDKHISAHNGLVHIVLIKPRAFSVILINLYFYFSLTPRL